MRSLNLSHLLPPEALLLPDPDPCAAPWPHPPALLATGLARLAQLDALRGPAPQLDDKVVARRGEVFTVRREGDGPDGRRVGRERLDGRPLVVVRVRGVEPDRVVVRG